jgi:hypothetical protein
MTAFDTREEDIENFAADLENLAHAH